MGCLAVPANVHGPEESLNGFASGELWKPGVAVRARPEPPSHGCQKQSRTESKDRVTQKEGAYYPTHRLDAE